MRQCAVHACQEWLVRPQRRGPVQQRVALAHELRAVRQAREDAVLQDHGLRGVSLRRQVFPLVARVDGRSGLGQRADDGQDAQTAEDGAGVACGVSGWGATQRHDGFEAAMVFKKVSGSCGEEDLEEHAGEGCEDGLVGGLEGRLA